MVIIKFNTTCDKCGEDVCQTCGACCNPKCDENRCPGETVTTLGERKATAQE